jgi:hypothetical protein
MRGYQLSRMEAINWQRRTNRIEKVRELLKDDCWIHWHKRECGSSTRTTVRCQLCKDFDVLAERIIDSL